MDKWTPKLEQATRSGGTSSASGSSCAFIQLTDSTGIKLYATKLERDASWVALGLAAEQGLAPAVGECIEIKGPFDNLWRPRWWPESFQPTKLYGFLTEVASTAYDYIGTELSTLRRRLYCLFDCDIGDLYSSNLGRLTDGTLVAIDLDGRFCDLMTGRDIRAVNEAWGGGFW